MECLWRLRAPQIAPVDGIADPLACAALDGIDHRDRDQDGRILRQRCDGPADGAGVDQRPRGIVDQHVVRLLSRQPLGRSAPSAPRRTALDRRQQPDAGGRRVIEIVLRRMDRHHDARVPGCAAKVSGCAATSVPASAVLLGRSPPKRHAGGDDNERAS